MKNNLLSQKILKTIKQGHIQPRPHWFFVVREIAVWIFAFVSALAGGLSLAVGAHILRTGDWGAYVAVDNFWILFFASLPYAWIIALIAFAWLAYLNVEFSKNAYKFKWAAVGVLMAAIIFGTVLHVLGAGRSFDELLYKKAPFYANLTNLPERVWMMNDRGFLSGQILSMDSENLFQLRDVQNKKWRVQLDEKVKIMPCIKMQAGEMMRLSGERVAEDKFLARLLGCPHFRAGFLDGPNAIKFDHLRIIK